MATGLAAGRCVLGLFLIVVAMYFWEIVSVSQLQKRKNATFNSQYRATIRDFLSPTVARGKHRGLMLIFKRFRGSQQQH